MARTPIVDGSPASAPAASPSPASVVAAEVKALIGGGDREAAQDRFGALVALQQRRALRMAYHYLRDVADADEAVQDAFVKVFLHIEQYREDRPFEVWFTRILVNSCLDRLKSRGRQQRWLAAPSVDEETGARLVEQVASADPSNEHRLLVRERWQKVAAIVAMLPDRQKQVFTLCHVDGRTPSEVAEATGMSPATVRVHLFRAIRKLRGLLGEAT
jgi:RNA polymerase sigma-70 factor, ECF subfamily